jgi:hypothetical protein
MSKVKWGRGRRNLAWSILGQNKGRFRDIVIHAALWVLENASCVLYFVSNVFYVKSLHCCIEIAISGLCLDIATT